MFPAQREKRKPGKILYLPYLLTFLTPWTQDTLGKSVPILKTLLDVAKNGISEMTKSLKQGDVINSVSFSDDAKIVLKLFSSVSTYECSQYHTRAGGYTDTPPTPSQAPPPIDSIVVNRHIL